MKIIFKITLLTIIFMVNSYSSCTDKVGDYYAGQNYFQNDTNRNLKLINLIFNKSYTTYAEKNPGHITGEFLQYYSGGYYHKGIDYRAKTPFEIYSPMDGEVICAGDTGNGKCGTTGFGMIAIYNSEHDVTLNFQHLSNIDLTKGTKVYSGITKIGKTGSIGASAAHLHIGLRKGKRTYAAALDYKKCTSLDPRIILDFISSNESTNSKNSSIFDGAGSLVSPNEDCYGCNKDIAQMHPHSGENSTVVFQWLYDADSCSQLDIYSEENIGDVIIRSKKWNGHLTKEAIKVKLNAGAPITIKRPDSSSDWTTFAVTTTEPLNFSNQIYAECKTSDDRYKNGVRSNVDKNLVDVSRNYFWSGTSSLISQATNRGSNQFGIDKDLVVTFETKKSLTSFQWYASSSCPKLKIMNGRSSRVNSPVNEVKIKGWAEEEWSDNKCSSTLPCTLDAPDGGGYYVIKVKSDADAIRFGVIGAQCVQ